MIEWFPADPHQKLAMSRMSGSASAPVPPLLFINLINNAQVEEYEPELCIFLPSVNDLRGREGALLQLGQVGFAYGRGGRVDAAAAAEEGGGQQGAVSGGPVDHPHHQTQSTDFPSEDPEAPKGTLAIEADGPRVKTSTAAAAQGMGCHLPLVGVLGVNLLLSGVDLSLDLKSRIGLVGPNGR